jgi:hypothetical protein
MNHLIKKPLHPLLRSPRPRINRLQCRNPLCCSILVNRITPQHPENRHIDLPRPGLRRHIRIHPARIIRPAPVPAPQRIPVRPDLILAVARRDHAILFPHIRQRDFIDIPRPHRPRINPKHPPKLRHINIHKFLPLHRGIPRREPHIRLRIPFMFPPPGDSRPPHQRLRQFPPPPDFISLSNLFLQ